MSDIRIKKPFGWHATSTKNGSAFDIGAADGANIALVHGPGNGGEQEFAANARLIAAALDLVLALRGILANDGGTGSEQFHAFKLYEARQAGFDALAKAEGRS